jgi:hypothetical protein
VQIHALADNCNGGYNELHKDRSQMRRKIGSSVKFKDVFSIYRQFLKCFVPFRILVFWAVHQALVFQLTPVLQSITPSP